MPRGIYDRSKPKEPIDTSQLVTGADTGTRVYWCYVHGETINSVAEKFELEVEDVLDIINKAEEAKG